MLVSGSLNVPGSPQKPGDGGTYLDNWEVPGNYHAIRVHLRVYG